MIAQGFYKCSKLHHVHQVFEKMSEPVLGTLMIYFLTSLCLCFIFIFIKLLNKLWWTPRRIEKLMALQGIKGPPYKILHGNTKEIISMKLEAMAIPMELSHHMFPRVLPHLYSWIKLYGMNFLNWIGPQAQLVVTEPELVKVILNNKDGTYLKTEPKGHVKKLLGDGLVTSQGEKWHKMRKLANHAFHAESLKGMTPAMISSVEMMLKRWGNHTGKEIDVFQEFKRMASEVISRTAFGSSYLEGENIFNMLTQMAMLIATTEFRIRIPGIGKFIKTSDEVEANKLEQGIRDSIIKLIKNREESVMSGEAEGFGTDFLGSLISAYHSDDQGKTISVDDLIDECKTFYIAGQETTMNLLSWTVLLLAIHTDWQEKAREEVLELFGKENPNTHGIARLTTMGMIINESARLYSPAIHIVRKVGREVKLGDLTLPADMEVYISITAIHHNTKIWGEDVHLFKPERFAEGVAKATNNNPTAYIPFGSGPRTCVGLNFATNETKIALSMILQRYRFTLSPNYVHSPVNLLIVRPQHGLQIILHAL